MCGGGYVCVCVGVWVVVCGWYVCGLQEEETSVDTPSQ